MSLTYTWACLGTGRELCGEHGAGPKSDLASRKHMEATRHGVYVRGVAG